MNTLNHQIKRMKKLIIALCMIFGMSFAGFAQTAPAAKKEVKKAPVAVKKAPAKKADSKLLETPVSDNNKAKLKKDGTPDKRYKANKHLKKDGTPDKRFKSNKPKA